MFIFLCENSGKALSQKVLENQTPGPLQCMCVCMLG